ncbi:MAG TPA: hypothetical protein PK872_05990 [Ferruginibacter sp.]|nr:hypothetical protein [Niastella sp.]HRB31043.1 hypothetical protein [Ferruginibacter sp.]
MQRFKAEEKDFEYKFLNSVNQIIMKEKSSSSLIELLQEKKSFVDLETKKKIEQHLSNINDVITDNDLRNVKTDISLIQPPITPRIF